MDACVVCLPVEPTGPQPYEPSVVHYPSNGAPSESNYPWIPMEYLMEWWKSGKKTKKWNISNEWMCRKMELSEINRQDEPRSTKLFSFWGFLFANVSRVRPTARVGAFPYQSAMMPWIAFNQDPFSIASNPEDKYVFVYWCVLAQRILTSNHAYRL